MSRRFRTTALVLLALVLPGGMVLLPLIVMGTSVGSRTLPRWAP